MAVFILLPFVAFFLGMRYEAYRETTQVFPDTMMPPSSQMTLPALPTPFSLPTVSVSSLRIHDDVELTLPSGAVVTSDIRNPRLFTVTGIQGATFAISVEGSVAGLCPWEDDGSGCTYDDEKIAFPTQGGMLLRIWKDHRGVFALNPQSVTVGTAYVNHMDISKTTPNPIFTDADITLWKNALMTLRQLEKKQF